MERFLEKRGGNKVYLFRIAARNLFRRRKRTLIIAGILALAVITFLFFDSFMIGMMDLSFGTVIDFETPHIEVGRSQFFAEADGDDELPLDEAFTPDEEMLAMIENREGFRAIAPVLDFSADFIAGRYEFPVLARSIEPDSFSEVFKHEEYIIEGEFVKPDQSGVVIGVQMAEFFDLEVGDFYTMRFQDKSGHFSTIEGEVKGIMSTPHPDMNQRTVIMDRSYAVNPLAVEESKITQLMIRMSDRDTALTEADKLAEMIANSAYQVRSYRDASDMLTSLEVWGYLETYFILALVLLVGAIGIVNVIVLSALERVEEIGMMKAMGLKENEIVKVFMLEAAGIGVIGGVIGCVIGGIIVGVFNIYGINLKNFFDLGEIGMPMPEVIYGAWNPSSFVFIFIIVVVIAILASIIPSYWAAKKDPAKAIHHK